MNSATPAKPNNISRRGFLRNILGVTTALILPAPVRVDPFSRAALRELLHPTALPRIRGLSVHATVYDEVADIDPNFRLPIKFDHYVYPIFRAPTSRVVLIRKARADTKSYWPPTLPLRDTPYKVKV